MTGELPETSNDGTEIGRSVDIDVVVDAAGNPVGAVVDDLIVATTPEGSITDETIDILDADGDLLVEDETVTVYDADGQVIARDETIIAAIDPPQGS
ncbi:MAG: hypothetical protein ACKN9D_15160 [Actinomycetales bacterium]|jgi:hypothetical protein